MKLLHHFSLVILISIQFSIHAQTSATIGTTGDTSKTVKPKIQIAFCLDATGSMASLIGAAKEKIWSIAGGLAQADPAPDIEMAMVFYRDKGDKFVTRVIPFITDLDSVYSILMTQQADGGGDALEHVNKALYDAVNILKWDKDTGMYKTIFLVGDYGPHMDYQDDIKYMVSCQKARKMGIIINTILMGNNSETEQVWRNISDCSHGNFAQTGMDVNNFEIKTPYDDSISIEQIRLDNQKIYYGNKKHKQEMELKKGKAASLNSSVKEKSITAKRSEFYNTKSGMKAYYGKNELIFDLEENKVKLDTISAKSLPDTMQKMSAEERVIYVKKIMAERTAIRQHIVELNKKRQDYIDAELAKKPAEEVKKSFNNTVFESVKTQSASKKIIIKGKAKY